MTRKSTRDKRKIVIREFKNLLRSGKDYTTNFLYAEAAKKAFLAPKTAGNIVRDYYRSEITDEMKEFVESCSGMNHEQKVDYFAQTFDLCTRESRLILGYIN